MSTQTDLTGVAAWAVDVMERLGPPGAGLLIAAENLFLPLPSEVILPLAGFTASQGSFTVLEAVVWTTSGSVVGALVLYVLGTVFGRERLRTVWARLPLVLTTFLAFTLGGSLVWNLIFVLAGYHLGESWHLVERYAGTFQVVVVVAVLLALAWFVVSRVRRLRSRRG